MITYVLDNKGLEPEEAQRHRGSCNAAISSGKTVEQAFDVADETVREYRRRVVGGYATPTPPTPVKHRLVSDDEVIARWLDNKTIYTAAENKIIGKLREIKEPVFLAAIPRLAGVSDNAVRSLVDADVLVPVEGKRDAKA